MARARSIDLGNPFVASLDGMCEVLLVRHGEQLFVKNMPIGDGVDAPLSELGRRQVEAVGQRLRSHAIDAVYASPLQRAFDTGAAIAGHHLLDVGAVEAVAEINLWEQLPQDQGLLDSIGAAELRSIMSGANRSRRWESYPYAESPDGFRRRVISGIDSIIERHESERVVLACHGGVINTYLSHIWQSPLDQVCSLHHSSITTIRGAKDARRVLQVNDYAHVLSFQDGLNPLNAL